MIPLFGGSYKRDSLRIRGRAHPMDKVDQQIVALLRENARRSFQDIGGRVALSAPAVKRRVDRLQEAGVIRGYSAVLDHVALGWSTHAIVSLFCEGRMPASDPRGGRPPGGRFRPHGRRRGERDPPPLRP